MQTGTGNRRSALIIEDETLVGMGLCAHLEAMGHRVIGQAASSGEATAMYRKHKPDLVLLDVRLDGADGIDLATRLMAERPCPMIVVSAFSDADMIARATQAGVFGYLIKPVNRDGLSAQIAIATGRFEEREKLQCAFSQVSQTLDGRKWIDKAKGLIMKRLSLDEPSAHRWLQQESQKRRISTADMAKQILDAEPRPTAR